MPRRVLGEARKTSNGSASQNTAVEPVVPASSKSKRASNDAVGPPDSSGVDTSLACPICAEKMLTLSQLNQHLDDEHFEGGGGGSGGGHDDSDTEQGGALLPLNIDKDFKNWFKESVIDNFISAPSSQSGSAGTPRKLKLDVFDSSFTFDNGEDERTTNGKPTKPAFEVTRAHWKKPHGGDVCHCKGCTKSLGLKNGIVNCRSCGRLFCDRHTMNRMKLDKDAHSDPHAGVWCRCCEECFVSRPCWQGQNDAPIVDLTRQFRRLRNRRVDQLSMEKLNLERRLYKLLRAIEEVGSGRRTLRDYREYERQPVLWDFDNPACSECGARFSLFNRRHHCRICGSAVCGDVAKGCSMPVPAGMIADIVGQDTEKFDLSKEAREIPVRVCRSCKRKLFDGRLAEREVVKLNNDDFMQYYTQFVNLRNRIDKARADAKTEQLIDCFGRIDQLGKTLSTRISAMDAEISRNALETPIDKYRLYKSLAQRIVGYLQEHLPALRSVQQAKLAEERKLIEQERNPTGKKKLTKRETRLKREKLMVLEEQRFMVQQMYDEAKKQRRFDDLKALDQNMDDLTKETEELRLELGDDAF